MTHKLTLTLLAASLVAGTATAESWHQCWQGCAAKTHFFERTHENAAADEDGNKSIRKYAPDRRVDVKHLKLEITPDFKARTIQGQSWLTFSPVAKPIDELTLHAVDLNVAKVECSQPIRDWHVEETQIVFHFENPIPVDAETTLSVSWDAQPERGLYFRTPEMGYKEGDTHLWTQGEPETHRFWFPGYDYPNERFTTEVVCHVQDGMTVVSNGRLLSEKRDEGTGLTAFHWLQDKPHVNYLITLVAGYFQMLEDKHGDLPLAFLTPPSEFPQAENSFRDTRKIIAFFEEEIGVKYPWDKYYNVVVQDFVAGGMENTSATTLTHRTLFSKASENLHSTHGLDAHEVAHQWFGDLVTCKDWSHLWLNEGFATYYTQLYEEHKNGRDSMLYGMLRNAQSARGGNDTKPIVYREYRNPSEQFGYRAYPKGAWVLHMLRSQLGVDLYRKCIQTYLERFENKTAVTSDLAEIIEELSGRSFDQFFDQWVYHGGHPKLKVGYNWDSGRQQAKLSISQTQKLSPQVLLFDFPLPVRFVGKDGTRHDFMVEVSRKNEDFYFNLPDQPQIVRVDPDLTVLYDLDFKPPGPQLEAQITAEDDMLGRLLAVRHFADKKDSASVKKLAERLATDSFHGVRIEAVKALRKIHSPEARDALLEHAMQDDARVRIEVERALSGFFDEEVRAHHLDRLDAEKNPDIVAVHISALAKWPGDKEIARRIAALLGTESYRHKITAAVIEVLRKNDDPRAIPAILEEIKAHGGRFETNDLGRALEAVAHLSRDRKKSQKASVRQFISTFVMDQRERLRVAAVNALGTLKDPRALPALEALVAGDEKPYRDPVRSAAERAIGTLKDQKKPVPEVRALRDKVSKLEKDYADLKKQLDELKNKSEPQKPEEKTPKEEKPAAEEDSNEG